MRQKPGLEDPPLVDQSPGDAQQEVFDAVPGTSIEELAEDVYVENEGIMVPEPERAVDDEETAFDDSQFEEEIQRRRTQQLKVSGAIAFNSFTLTSSLQSLPASAFAWLPLPSKEIHARFESEDEPTDILPELPDFSTKQV
jgi:hypothetical protein